MNYNTDINIIVSITDYHLIYMGLQLILNDSKNLDNILVTNKEFNFRTENSWTSSQIKF